MATGGGKQPNFRTAREPRGHSARCAPIIWNKQSATSISRNPVTKALQNASKWSATQLQLFDGFMHSLEGEANYRIMLRSANTNPEQMMGLVRSALHFATEALNSDGEASLNGYADSSCSMGGKCKRGSMYTSSLPLQILSVLCTHVTKETIGAQMKSKWRGFISGWTNFCSLYRRSPCLPA